MTPPTASDPSPRRLPIIATIVVGAAVALMIALGVWQLGRANEKSALLAAYNANRTMSADTRLPNGGPVPDAVLYRHTSAVCLRVIGWKQVGGNDEQGQSGFRQLADCATGAEGPGFVADMGVSTDPAFRPRWQGGTVSGVITREPVEGGLIAKLRGVEPVARPMLVADQPAPGLVASMPPDPASVPNNHLSYAVQWFAFALIALVIYGLALRRRWQR